MKQYLIFMDNALEALGLEQLLTKQFGIQAHIVTNATQVTALPNIEAIFTDAVTFAANIKSLLPRQAHTIILSHRHIEDNDSPSIICYNSLEQLSDKLSPFFKGQNTEQSSHTSSTLSQRETEILKLIASGCINKEIASRLCISINTVLTHRKNITAKLGIKSVSGLTFYAMMNGIVAPQ